MKFGQAVFLTAMLMNAAGDGNGGGGGTPPATPPANGGADPKAQADDLRAMNQKLLERIDALEKRVNPQGNPQDPEDLANKARVKREEIEKQQAHERRLEAAVKFTTGSKEFVKTNSSLLPKTIEGIFEQAEKENYGSTIEKESAIKVGIISEFFAIQSNLDLLTASQKTVLEDFKKLTKTDKQDRAASIYDSIFEPTFETLKKVKRAEQVSKGFADPTNAEAAYREKLVKGSRKHYLGEKQ